MKLDMLFSILSFAVLVVFIAYQRFVLPNMTPDKIESATEVVDKTCDLVEKFQIVFDMAKKYVVYAKKQYEDGEGDKKRNWVIKQLRAFGTSLGLELTDNQLKSINEAAYVEMKQGEK